ncbi:NEL-type E3 ubiquitin ligase domain-containing protein [Pseudomonas sp. P9_31]|uniref:NEL-type E3 ubiquitin ligase domain-containing protein n=1 Tax=Pseudomonas sp. P9_31 TaxID=3043448 RepID=UPI002A367677|nr:NEL-type E3 ubiquitin ligase domain-containing protein [Pseudomonas sp. P9_31]WPN59166.1 NEL-type E3 ubiquitin ligase domain-containing protein [Pseudomonas sp. P9_31]
MPDSHTPAKNTNKGRHYAFIKNTINDNFKTATVSRGQALAATGLKIVPWYTTAPAAHHDKLKAANLKAWGSQNQVDQLFEKLRDVHSFAAPLLQAKLKERYGIENDVTTTYLRLYMPKDQPWYAIDLSGGVTARTVSLLDAALHNFARAETVDAGSQFITKPDKRGHFEVIPIKHKMTIRQFQALCRELDIGALYKKHLESYLLPGEPLAEAVMKHKVTESQKDALTVAAQLALITGDIQYDAYKLMLDLAQDTPQLLLNEKQMLCCDLSMMDTRLTGIVLLIHAVRGSSGIRRLIAYVPHDPDHPLKEYESTEAFTHELVRQLREDKIGASSQLSYRQFFSQFVDQQQRGHFFAGLEQRLFTVKWHTKEDPTDQRPAWRKEPVLRPRLQIEHWPLPRDYWRHAYQQKLNKILNDAREIAVSTADTDSKARWAWWDNFKKIVSDIFNVALLIATPFVPGLGELMMAYTAYQLTTDVIEGIVDLAEGLGLEAAEHVISVVTDVIQLAAFGAGAEIGNAFRLKLSPLVEGMKPVKLPNGKHTLWHPDLAPYEQKNLTLSAASKPNEHGLHRHANQDILPLEGKLYIVEKASTEPTSNTHRVKHPTRPNAYSPKMEHNGHGAWVHEAENPRDWEGETLMRRLGHSVDRFSPTELEQIRISSGTDDNELRRMHVDNSPPPPVLADTIKRFSAYDEVQTASANIRGGRPIDPASVWFEPIMTGLPGWPPERALRVYENADLTGYSRKYGNANATDANTLSMSLADLTSGKLPERVVGFLNEAEVSALLGRDMPSAERNQALRNLLADAVDERQGELSKRLYQAGERSNKADVRLLKQTFPDMPLTLTEKLLSHAKAAELQRMIDEDRLPLRIKTQARELNFEASTARAYDGFYRDERVLPDTERLALNTLKLNTDGFGDVRIEVLDGTYDGTLRCSIGPDDATTVRRLIRDEHGQYEVLEGANKKLHDAGDFYESILRALPEDKRAALGYQRGQGRLLKAWIMEQCAPAAERRTLLAEPPILLVANIETVNLVRGPSLSTFANTPEKRVRNLYPKLNEQEVRAFVEALRAKGDPDKAIDRLRDELVELKNILAEWENKAMGYVSADSGSGPEYDDFRYRGGRHIRERLLECFERKSEAFGGRNSHPEGGYTLDLSSDFMGPKLDRWWKDLREQPNIKKYIDQVTVLNVDNARFSPDTKGLLNDFPNVRHLSARHSGLTELPPSVGTMRLLESLRLTDNSIQLTADSAKSLRELTRLETLRLDNNPLKQPPDVGHMPRLRVLSLNNTGIYAWPEGLFKEGVFEKHHPRGFSLDLRECPITNVPDVVPGSDHAFLVARTRLDATKLSDVDRVRFGDYRESVGLAREQVYERAAANELSHWQSLPDSEIYSQSAGIGTYREENWHDVMAEPDSTDFFKVIRKQRAGKDYRSDNSRKQLTRRVWQMIDAVALDTDLREELFKQAKHPETCGDAGAQLFNNMGIKVLVSQAHAESTTGAALENKLVKLARSAARLEKINEIARAEVESQNDRFKSNPGKFDAPDPVEVHLAYETGLAKRLDLPWQSESMLYQTRADVDAAKINAAYDSVIAFEEGDGLVDGMIGLFENPFWEKHLRKTHPDTFDASDRRLATKHALLEDLRTAQNNWANARTPAERSSRKGRVETLANQLNIPHTQVFTGREMTTQFYDRMLSEMAEERNELARTLTRKALANAGL